MRPFHGVATKYLEHYLGGSRTIETFGEPPDSALWLPLSVGGRDGEFPPGGPSRDVLHPDGPWARGGARSHRPLTGSGLPKTDFFSAPMRFQGPDDGGRNECRENRGEKKRKFAGGSACAPHRRGSPVGQKMHLPGKSGSVIYITSYE